MDLLFASPSGELSTTRYVPVQCAGALEFCDSHLRMVSILEPSPLGLTRVSHDRHDLKTEPNIGVDSSLVWFI